MVEIQQLFLILIVVMGIIGMVRGFLKELGVTLVLIATLFALDRLIPDHQWLHQQRRLRLSGTGASAANSEHRQSAVHDFRSHDGRGDVHRLSGRDAGL